MPKYRKHWRVFVSSPDDVQSEVDAVKQTIDKLNKINASSSTRLDFVNWKTNVSPGMAERTQEVINKSIGDDYDIYVGIMWKKFGPGTVEEFEHAYERHSMLKDNIEIMFYFKEIPTEPDESDLEQIEEVEKFRDRISLTCLYGGPFKEVSEFREMLESHLPETIRILKRQEKSKRAIQKDESRTKTQNSTSCELLYEHNEDGKSINGTIHRLIDAVTEGCAIRIRVHHPNGTIQVMSAPLLSVENGVVHASDIDQISKTRDQSGDYIYQDKSYHYFVIASSNGHFHAKRIFFDGTDRNTTKSKRHIAWIRLASPNL